MANNSTKLIGSSNLNRIIPTFRWKKKNRIRSTLLQKQTNHRSKQASNIKKKQRFPCARNAGNTRDINWTGDRRKRRTRRRTKNEEGRRGSCAWLVCLPGHALQRRVDFPQCRGLTRRKTFYKWTESFRLLPLSSDSQQASQPASRS